MIALGLVLGQLAALSLMVDGTFYMIKGTSTYLHMAAELQLSSLLFIIYGDK
jgi:hypothetical protein